MTQTIISAFGSSIMLPDSGILMANRMMWFDHLPGATNSVLGGRRPLTNMFPVIQQAQDGSVTTIGTLDRRKIFPAVLQLTTFILDYDMTIDGAICYHRLDVTGTDQVNVMAHTDETFIRKLARRFPRLIIRPSGVNPNLFSLPQITQREASERMTEGCFVPSPHSKVSEFNET